MASTAWLRSDLSRESFFRDRDFAGQPVSIDQAIVAFHDDGEQHEGACRTFCRYQAGIRVAILGSSMSLMRMSALFCSATRKTSGCAARENQSA